MTISEVHWRLGHISHAAIKHAISSGQITGINLDMDLKPEFCEPCAKAKSIQQPFPKKLDTQAETFGEYVHWDLWGPASAKSLSGNLYVAVRIDDHTCETQQYFQPTESQTFNSYKHDEAMIETHSRHQIKFCCSNRGGEFWSKQFNDHQDSKGTL